MGDSDSEEQYEFSSPPSVPREKGGDILVKIQAVTSTNPSLLTKSYRLFSRSSVAEVRRRVKVEFDPVFENGFVFLCKNTEILTSRETTLTLGDILPKAGLGKPFVTTNTGQGKRPHQNFTYPSDITYRKLPFERDGRRYSVTCIGILYLCDASGVSHWNKQRLRESLDAHSVFGFSFIPSDITSSTLQGSIIEELNQYAAVAKLNSKDNEDEDEHPDGERVKKKNFEICKENIEKVLSTKINEESMKDRSRATPLHFAAMSGNLKMCQFLCMRLDREKLLYEKDIFGRTPLHCALSRVGVSQTQKQLKVVGYLLTYIQDSQLLDEEDAKGVTCYNMILGLGKEDTVFLMKMLDPDNIDQKLVLHFCCCALQYRELSEAVKYCESAPVVKPTFMRPPLHLAAEFGTIDIVDKLISAGHSIFDRDPNGYLPLHYACQHGTPEFILSLYHEEMKEEDALKTLKIALNSKNFSVLTKLFELRVYFLWPALEDSNDVFEPFIKEARKDLKNFGKAIIFLFNFVQPEVLETHFFSFLNQAAFEGLTDLVRLFLENFNKGASLFDEMERCGLHDAVQGASHTRNSTTSNNCLEIFKHLHKAMDTLQLTDWRGSTPLHCACMEGNLEFVTYMLKQKDLTIASMQDSSGRTPLLVAAHCRKGRKVLDYMIKHHLEDLSPYSQDADGKNILHYIGNMSPPLIDTLLQKLKKIPNKTNGPYIREQFQYPYKTDTQMPSRWETEFIHVTERDKRTCRYCNEDLKKSSGSHFCQLRMQMLPANTDLSAVETLIVQNKPDTLKKLVEEMPGLLAGEEGVRARFRAVRMWRLKCAQILISGVSKQKKFMDKYLLAALERKPSKWLPESEYNKLTKKSSLKNENLPTADRNEEVKQKDMIVFLLKKGANPYYVPPQEGFHIGQKNEFSALRSPHIRNEDIPVTYLRFCSAIERAVAFGNKELIDLFLDQSKTCVRRSFAVHLAAKSGDVTLLEPLLLTLKKEMKSQSKDESELAFVSTLQNGILAAACASDNPSLALFEVLQKHIPEAFKGSKLVTFKLIANTRPVMLKILKIHDLLPLTLFMGKQHRELSLNEKEIIACFVLQNGSYPVQMRVTRSSFIHPACDLFIQAYKVRMWRVLAILIHRSGQTLWSCLWGGNDDNHKCHRKKNDDRGRWDNLHVPWDGQPRQTDLQRLMQELDSLPIELVSMFTRAGLKAVRILNDHTKEILLEGWKNADSENKSIQDWFDALVWELWKRPLTVTISGKRLIKKLKVQKPQASTGVPWLPKFVDVETTPLDTVKTIVGKSFTSSLVFEIIQVRKSALFQPEIAKLRSLEKGFIEVLQRVRLSERSLTSLQITVAFERLDLASHIIKSNDDVRILEEDEVSSLLDIAARKADLPMVKLLVKHELLPTKSTLKWASQRSTYSYFERSVAVYPSLADPGGSRWYKSPGEEDALRLEVLKFLAESIRGTDRYALMKYAYALEHCARNDQWTHVDYLLDIGASFLDSSTEEEESTEDQEESDDKDSSAPENEYSQWARFDYWRVKNKCKGLLRVLIFGSNDLALKSIRSVHRDSWDLPTLTRCFHDAASANKTDVVQHLLDTLLFSSSHPLSKPETVQQVICPPRIHPFLKRGFHALCQNGAIDLIQSILSNLKDQSYPFLHASDNPIWYSMSNSHWKLSELLLLNGASPKLRKEVVDWIRLGPGVPIKAKTTQRLFQKIFPMQTNSINVAKALRSKNEAFLKPQEIMTSRTTSVPAPHLKPSSPRSRTSRIEGFKRVKYLLTMAQIGESFGGNIFHAAVVQNDISLIREIKSQPLFSTMMTSSGCKLLPTLALANGNAKTIKEVRKLPQFMNDEPDVIENTSAVVIALSNKSFSHLSKVRNRERDERELKKSNDERHIEVGQVLFTKIATACKQGRQFLSPGNPGRLSIDDLANEVVELLPPSEKQTIPEVCLLALSVVCKPKVFAALVEHYIRNLHIASQEIVPNCTLTDAVILLNLQKDNQEVISCLQILSKGSFLSVSDWTVHFLIKRNMTRMLRIIFESVNSQSVESLLEIPWLDVFTLAASRGDNVLLKMNMRVLSQNTSRNLIGIANKALKVSCKKGYSDIVDALLAFANSKEMLINMDIISAVKEAAKHGRVQILKTLLKPCLKFQKLNVDLVVNILKRSRHCGSRTLFQTVFDLGEEYFKADRDKLKSTLPTVLLHCAKHGHEQLCLYILEKFPDVDVKEQARDRDKEIYINGVKKSVSQRNQGATVLHYACSRGLKKLAVKLLEMDVQLAKADDRDQLSPFFYARAMGHVDLLREVSSLHGFQAPGANNERDLKLLYRGETVDELSDLHFGWLRYNLANNETANKTDEKVGYYRHIGWASIEQALKQNAENEALAMLYSAEDLILYQLKHSYEEKPLVHQASQYGSSKVLAAIIKCMDKDYETLKQIMKTEIKGFIPIALAIQSKSKECVKLLKEIHEPTVAKMGSLNRGDNIFHFAVKANDEEILKILLESSKEDLHSQNDNGSTAAQECIALGHHNLLPYFFPNGIQETAEHRTHKEVDHRCLECLMDSCIGWSKAYLTSSTEIPQLRNVWDRKKSVVGFTESNGNLTHVLETLLEYAEMSKTTAIVEKALMAIGYEPNIETAKLFLLRSNNFSVKECLSRGWESTAITLLKNMGTQIDEDDLSNFLDMAIANDAKEVVRHLKEQHPNVISTKPFSGLNPFEVAISMQRYDIFDELKTLLAQDKSENIFSNLDNVKECVPLQARWLAGISQPGDDMWLKSVDNARLSEANVLMLHTSNERLKSKLDTTSNLDSMFPERIHEKPLKVDVESFKRGCAVPVSDAWLFSVIASYLNTLRSTLESGTNYEEVDVVELSCLPASSKVPFMEVSTRFLKDRVKLEVKDDTKRKGTIFQIMSSDRLPTRLHQDARSRNIVETDLIPKAESLVADVTGHTVKVKVDWASFNAEFTEERRTTLYSILAGRDLHSALGGLIAVLETCLGILTDVKDLAGESAAAAIQDLFVPLREIVVKHSAHVSKPTKIMFCMIDQSLPWFVNFSDNILVSSSHSFPMYGILTACHSVCVHIAGGLSQLAQQREDYVGKVSDNVADASIDWKSFGSIGDTNSLSVLGRQGLRLDMCRLAAGLKHLLWYRYSPKHILLKNVAIPSQTDVEVDGDTLTISVFATRSHNVGWTNTGLDIYSKLHELEVKWLLQNYGDGKGQQCIESKEMASMFGLQIPFLWHDAKVLECLAKTQHRQMTSPQDQLYLHENYLDKMMSEVCNDFKEFLLSCSGVWQIEKSPNKEAGLWCWLTMAELQNGISYNKFLVKLRSTVNDPSLFKVVTKAEAKGFEPMDVSGVWFYQPFQMSHDTKTIKRLQLMSFDGMLYLVTDPSAVQELLLKIPTQIKIVLTDNEENNGEKTLLVPLGTPLKDFRVHHRFFSGKHKSFIDNKGLIDCWRRGCELGVNIFLDTESFRQAGVQAPLMEQIAEGVTYSMEQFVNKPELVTTHICSKLLSSQGVIIVGGRNMHENSNVDWTAEGSSPLDRLFSIVPLSQTDMFVSYDKVLSKLSDTSSSVEISSSFAKVLNQAFAHRVTESAERELVTILQETTSARNVSVDVSFLSPTDEDTFIPQASYAKDTCTTVLKYLSDASRAMRDHLSRDIKKLDIKASREAQQCAVRYENSTLKIVAVQNDSLVPVEDIAKGILASLKLDSPDIARTKSRFLKFSPVGYPPLCPERGKNVFKLTAMDPVGRKLTGENDSLNKMNLKRLQISNLNNTVDVANSNMSIDEDKIKVDCVFKIKSFFPQYGPGRYLDFTTSILWDGKSVFGPMALRGPNKPTSSVVEGTLPNEIFLEKEAFVLYPKHSFICSKQRPKKTSNDSQQLRGFVSRDVYLQGIVFEVSFRQEFEASPSRFSVKALLSSSFAANTEKMYAFRLHRKRAYIRARCRACSSFLDLHTSVNSVNAGSFLKVTQKT